MSILNEISWACVVGIEQQCGCAGAGDARSEIGGEGVRIGRLAREGGDADCQSRSERRETLDGGSQGLYAGLPPPLWCTRVPRPLRLVSVRPRSLCNLGQSVLRWQVGGFPHRAPGTVNHDQPRRCNEQTEKQTKHDDRNAADCLNIARLVFNGIQGADALSLDSLGNERVEGGTQLHLLGSQEQEFAVLRRQGDLRRLGGEQGELDGCNLLLHSGTVRLDLKTALRGGSDGVMSSIVSAP